ncbi:restriction endonuclease [Cylindrospermum stagnale PCC 7417]|uniref:Restriction endonuclease n=1 Tax=Cylindrospermum stagnale PCC 7417 TaxID=56107 RepID=K9X3V7_9NOST|nr:restriction endonuclease [Cylindrospermum stagnale]AFZ26779.1 restriction endonuclease [Cylindrospermum stagnale PCC 7417]
MKYQGTYDICYNEETDEYGILDFPPLEVENRVLAEVERIYPGMKIPLSKVKTGELDRELAFIQQGKKLSTFEPTLATVIAVIKDASRKFAQLIAQNSQSLEEIEWRDLERTLAEVLEGIGFSVELTPGSKDGGKDIIVKYVVSGIKQTYIVEIKHWRAGSRVGHSTISDFLNVIVLEHRQGGLFLSTSGYCDNVFEIISKIERQTLRLGGKEKIVSLCKTYIKAQSGVWTPPDKLTDVLFEQTL